MKPVLDYSDYVELSCSEEDAVYRSFVSIHDVRRSGPRFLEPADRPTDSMAVPRTLADKLYRRSSEYDNSRHLLFGAWHHLSQCPYCRQDTPTHSLPIHLPDFCAVTLRQCKNCGWWDTEEELHVEYPDPSDLRHYVGRSIHRRAVLREFNVAGSDVPLATLQNHLLSHPAALYSVDPYHLERLVASVFREHMNCDAIHLGGPGDRGIDLVLIDGERRYVVQVKRRSRPDKAEQVSCVREFVGAMVLDGTLHGMFVSTASHFTRQARQTAAEAQSKGVVEYLELVDGKRLLEICQLTATTREPNWQQTLSSREDLSSHVNSGFSEFMVMATGSSDWKVSRDA